jgi:hypothetical protein
VSETSASGTSASHESDVPGLGNDSRLPRPILEEPTQVDLRSICVQVSSELRQSSRRFQKISARGWPLVGGRDKDKDAEAEEENTENSEGIGDASGNANAVGENKNDKEAEGCGSVFRLRMKPAKMDHDEVDSDSNAYALTAGPSSSNHHHHHQEEETMLARRKRREATCEIERIDKDEEEELNQSLPHSTATLQLMDALELYLATKGPMTELGARKKRSRQRQVATALVPHFLVKLFTKLDSLPDRQTFDKHTFTAFGKRLRKLYLKVLSDVGSEVGLGQDNILRAMDKLVAKLERNHPPPPEAAGVELITPGFTPTPTAPTIVLD